MKRIEGRSGGFTLIEMLVVIAIITILATGSAVFFLRVTQSRGLREGARVFESAFSRARRAAANTRENHYLVFQDDSGSRPAIMHVVHDLNNVGTLDSYDRAGSSGNDQLVEEFALSDFIQFQLGSDSGSADLFTSPDGSGRFWIRFGPDGEINGASADPSDPLEAFQQNRSWRETPDAPTVSNGDYDFYMKRTTGDKLFIDWEPMVGKISGRYYAN